MTNSAIYLLSGSLKITGTTNIYTTGYPPPPPIPTYVASYKSTYTKTVPVASDRFGQTVAMSDTTMVVGVPGANTGAGILSVYTLTAGSWVLTTTLTAGTYSSVNANLGNSVSISGNYIVAGASGENNNTGSVYVFENINGTWSTTPVAQLKSNFPTSGDLFGASVSIDNGIIVVGSPGNSYNATSAGLVFVYVGSSSSWALETQLAPHKGNIFVNAQFGNAVSVSNGYAAVGASQQNSQTGAAFVFNRTAPGVWTTSVKITPSSPVAGSQFGSSLFIKGQVLIIGAPSSNGGQAYAFYNNFSTWAQQAVLSARSAGGLIADTSVQSTDNQGVSVYYDSVKNVAVVGSSKNNNGLGVAYLYENVYGSWYASVTPNSKITASNGTTNDNFGAAVSINSGNIAVGSPQKTINGNIQSGEIYTYTG